MSKKTTESVRHEGVSEDHLGLERIIFFSDAVFAIAITLLALEIRIPAAGGSLTDIELRHALLSIWPNYLGYCIGFMTIGVLWMSHHRKFRLIQRYNRILLLLNLLFLMVIAFIPFPTAIISEYGNRTSTIFFALVISLASILLVSIWWYATHRNRLVDSKLDFQRRRQETLRSLFVLSIFAISIGLALINEDLAKFSWTLLLIAFFR